MNDTYNELPQNEFTLRDLLYVLFRHKIKIISFFLIISFLVVAYVFITPDIYVSQASLLVKEGRENLNVIPTTDSNRTVTASRSITQDINNEIEILRSPDVFSELVDTIGLEKLLGDQSWMLSELSDDEIVYLHEDVVLNIMANVDVGQKRNTNILGISYRSTDPQLAHDIVDNLINIFMDRHFDVHYSEGSYDFYLSQTEDSQKELERIEDEIAKIQSQLNVGSIEEYRAMLLSRIEMLQQDYDQNTARLAESYSRKNKMEEMLVALPETIETGRVIGSESSLSELYALRLREQEILSKYNEDSFQVKDIRRQISEATRIINEESQINTGVNENYQQIQQSIIEEETSYASLQARNEELEKMLGSVKNELKDLNAVSVTIQQLERQRQMHLDNYMKYSQSLEESRIDQVVQRQKLSNIRVNQSATFPKRPLQSKKIRNLILGLIVGLLGGIGLAFMFEYLDHTMRRQEDIEKWLQLQTLVVIPDH